MNVRGKIGLAFLLIVLIIPATPGRMPASGKTTGQNSPMQMALATRTPTRKPTRTPTPTPRPTSQSKRVFDLNEIIYFGAGGHGAACGTWEEVKDDYPAGTKLPFVTTVDVLLDSRLFCAYGFPPEVPATIEFYAPNGLRAATFTDPPTADTLFAQVGRDIYITMPYGLPYGTWTVVVQGGSRTAKDTFEHPQKEHETIYVTHLLPRDVLHPLDPRWYAPFKQGEQAAIYAAGYAADSEVLVAVAPPSKNDDSSKFKPVIAWKARTNSLGHLYLQFTIDSSYQNGVYMVFARPNTGIPEEEDDWISKGFTVYSPWHPCKGAPLSNLHVGEAARLMPGLQNNVRNRPRLSGRRVGQIQAYQNVLVEDGPKCNDGMVWWYVKVLDTLWHELNLEGWTAEGDDSGYWLLPQL